VVTRKNEAALKRGVRERRETAVTCRIGNRGTRRETIPLKMVTVCAGTSWEKATRKEICRGMVPLTEVSLEKRGSAPAGMCG
jgi:hypothetical protein